MLIFTFCLSAWKLPAHRREQRESRTPSVGQAFGEENARSSAGAHRCSQPGDHWCVVGIGCSITDSSSLHWGDSLCLHWESCGGYQFCSCRQKLRQNCGERKEARLFLMWTLNYFFFKSCGYVAALCEAVFPAAEFNDANGATEILNTGCTHDGETDVVISEVIVQNKDWTKCIWTHELFFPLFSPPLCLSLVCWACFFLFLMHPPPLLLLF